ncbi:MAG: sensor histidine kinase [Microbacterium sp.]
MPSPVRRVPFDEWVMPGVPYRSLAGDAVQAAVALLAGVAAWVIPVAARWILPLPDDLLRWHWPIVGLSVAVLLVKRRFPVTAVAVGSAQLVVLVLTVGVFPALPAIVVVDVLYAAMLYATQRRRLVVCGLAAAAVLAQVISIGLREASPRVVPLAIGLAAVLSVPLIWGTAVRQRDELLRAETERADAIARASEAERTAAVRAERADVASQLHDEIAARLSAISLQASALASRTDDPRAADAIAAMRASSREALGELHTLIGVLAQDRADDGSARDHGSSATPDDPTEALRQQAAAFGIDLAIDGDAGSLPPPVTSALERIGREAIANAAKHAPGTAVSVFLSRDRDAVTMRVENALAGSAGARTTGSGLGTRLMSARWEAVGGIGSAGPVEGAWRVETTVPSLDPDHSSREQR